MKQYRKELFRYRRLLFLAIAVGIVLRWWSQRDQAERLMDIPGSYAWTIYQERMYWLASSRHGGMILRSIPARGGSIQSYGSDSGNWREVHIVGINETGIYYTAEQEQQGYSRFSPRAGSNSTLPSTQGIHRLRSSTPLRNDPGQ